MLEIQYPEIFAQTVEAAKLSTGGDSRWVAAIDRAAKRMQECPAQFHWTGGAMLIQSPASDEVYEANGTCKCEAYIFRQPCWHRCAARLWLRYLEAVREITTVQVW
jgi:hypothetical protein